MLIFYAMVVFESGKDAIDKDLFTMPGLVAGLPEIRHNG